MGYLSCRRKSAVVTAYSQSPTTRKLKLRIFRHQDLYSATSGFSSSTFLGRGSHASVFLATLHGGRLLAAVKVPSPPPPDDGPSTTNTDNEIDVLSSLPRRAPRLVNLLGHTRAAPRLAVVELMPGGSLHDLLHHSPHPPPLWGHRLRLALHVAEAVAFLHSLHPPVVHRDIKPSNVLIDADGRARLGDFGLAVRLATVAPPPAPAGTMGYIDPAYVTPGYLTPVCDVYSYGVLLLEIVSGRRAIDMDHSPPSLVDWAAPLIEAGRFEELRDPRVEAPPAATEEREVAVMAGRCVVEAAEGRPCMAEVVVSLRSVGRAAAAVAAGEGAGTRQANGRCPTWRRRVRVTLS